MVEIQFDFNHSSTIIQAKLEEPFQNIIDIYFKKTSFEPSLLKFQLNDKPINPNESIECHMNEQDKKNKKLKILVSEIEKDKIYKSKDIICPKCKEQCLISFENFKIKLVGCPNEHIIKNIKLRDFTNTQNINISTIKCNKCKLEKKSNFKNDEFFICLNCQLNLCLLCKNKHDLNHNIITYDQKNYLCRIHNEPFFKYCKQCNENICFSCDEHNNHELLFLVDLKPNIDEKKKILNEIKIYIDSINKTIKEVINKLNRFTEDINKYYEINKRIFENYNVNRMNYQNLKNIQEISNNNRIYKLLKYINDDNNIKERLLNILNLYENLNKDDINEEIFDEEIINNNEIKEDEKDENYQNALTNINNQTNEMTIIYNIKGNNKIRIFGHKFVEKNKDKYYLIINNKNTELKEYLDEKIEQQNKLEIKLVANDIITNMNYMFYCCDSLNTLSDISKWDIKNVVSFSEIFFGCSSLITLPDISKWDTKNITDISYMFYNCSSLISLPDISKWDTKNITDISYMFYGCSSLISLPDISKWNIKNIRNFINIFDGCKSLVSLPDISNWDTKNIISINNIFAECNSLISLPDISNWDIKNVKYMEGVFHGCHSLHSLPDISKWETKNVTTMNHLFGGCVSLISLPDISKWDTKKVQNMCRIFSQCYRLKSLPDISKWDTKNVCDMSYMFYNCTSLESLPDISKWDTTGVCSMSYMFYECKNLKSLPGISKWKLKSYLEKENMFGGLDEKIIPKKFKDCLIF